MALVRKYKAKITLIEKHTDTLFSLTLKSEGKPFKFKPCQFLHLAIDEYSGDGAWPESRCFSIASAPSEDCDELKIIYSVVGKFTKLMATTLTLGSNVHIKMAYGTLFDDVCSQNETVFIAGGTGITPFLSLFYDSSFASFLHPALYFGLRNSAMNIYDLSGVSSINPDFISHIIYENENGKLDMRQIMAEHPDAVYVISGPQQMIQSFKSIVQDIKGNTNQIVTDDWE